jgi:hypothetical protein
VIPYDDRVRVLSLRTAPLWISLIWVVGIEVCAERVAWSWERGVVEGLGMGMLYLGSAVLLR